MFDAVRQASTTLAIRLLRRPPRINIGDRAVGTLIHSDCSPVAELMRVEQAQSAAHETVCSLAMSRQLSQAAVAQSLALVCGFQSISIPVVVTAGRLR